MDVAGNPGQLWAKVDPPSTYVQEYFDRERSSDGSNSSWQESSFASFRTEPRTCLPQDCVGECGGVSVDPPVSKSMSVVFPPPEELDRKQSISPLTEHHSSYRTMIFREVMAVRSVNSPIRALVLVYLVS